jgi:hypothetical protein
MAGVINSYDAQGQPLPVVIYDGAASAAAVDYRFQLQPHESKVVWLTDAGFGRNGWLVVSTVENETQREVETPIGLRNVYVSFVWIHRGMSLPAPLAATTRTQFSWPCASPNHALAVVNIDPSADNVVSIRATDRFGNLVAQTTCTLPGGGQAAGFVSELLPELPPTFQGTIEVSGTLPVAAILANPLPPRLPLTFGGVYLVPAGQDVLPVFYSKIIRIRN